MLEPLNDENIRLIRGLCFRREPENTSCYPACSIIGHRQRAYTCKIVNMCLTFFKDNILFFICNYATGDMRETYSWINRADTDADDSHPGCLGGIYSCNNSAPEPERRHQPVPEE